ncbi:phosphatase PAP2 family protein [Rhodoferax sp.]|uniref:phosphatase PAP2 family protein n=1 Tax=Rhodoferax sp. TaxID=50421 RepID=UPI0027312A9E|nr:phosphatase PAP2 family protein [Rhodoferax sp.]MDP1528830.1 phosphatase PAP2 family protein [Rhodoferax sp.]MDP1943685.1 phosphatase PAP2 family protein [Rhodoferax sp.]MDP2440878.1 phosphatase PAP2 family protein [Rhodoferax sp.]MDZ4207593.1 phosphatase PAP2 family protein [Rhodoferax sp.]
MYQSVDPPTLSDWACSRRTALITGSCLTGLLIWDASGLDLAVMHGLANEQGFSLRDNWWLADLLHTGGRQLAGVVFLAVLVMIGWPIGWFRTLPRWQRIEIVLGIVLCLLTISSLKHFSLTSCPWDLQEFGGKASYVSHWTWGTRDGGAGHCFPAGHASSALAFIALALPWLFSGNARLHRRGQWLLLLVLFSGLVLGLAQTLRGAHYPSHSLWTAWICWIVTFVNHLVFNWLGKH